MLPYSPMKMNKARKTLQQQSACLICRYIYFKTAETQQIEAGLENPLCREGLPGYTPILMIHRHGQAEGPGGNVFSQVWILPNGKTFVCYHISLLAMKMTHSLSKDPRSQPSNRAVYGGRGLLLVKTDHIWDLVKTIMDLWSLLIN